MIQAAAPRNEGGEPLPLERGAAARSGRRRFLAAKVDANCFFFIQGLTLLGNKVPQPLRFRMVGRCLPCGIAGSWIAMG